MLPSLAFYTLYFDTVMHYSDLNPMSDSVEIVVFRRSCAAISAKSDNTHSITSTTCIFLGAFCKTAAYFNLHFN